MYASDLRHPDESLEKKLQAIYSLRRDKTIDLTIRNPYYDLLAALGDPHLNLPPVIHVAGTNGKGSTIAMLSAIYEAAGFKTHLYTSPHLHKFNERIVLAGHMISDKALHPLLDEVLDKAKDLPLTFFEVTTALAFLAFAQTDADITILETGLGGRLDCTNVIEKPLATIISKIGYDHMDFLGDTLEEIALEKAGIMKQGVPCIIAKQETSATTNILKQAANKTNAPIYSAGSEWVIEPHQDHLKFNFADKKIKTALPSLQGEHQFENSGNALSCIAVLQDQFPVPQSAIDEGLRNTRWPGRLEHITEGKLINEKPASCELWFDGGHNESAAQALATQAQKWQKTDGKPLYLALGMMKHKDPATFIKPLLPYLDGIFTLNIPDEDNAFTAPNLAKEIRSITDIETQETEKLNDIYQYLNYKKPDTFTRILIGGSFYLAALQD